MTIDRFVTASSFVTLDLLFSTLASHRKQPFGGSRIINVERGLDRMIAAMNDQGQWSAAGHNMSGLFQPI
ncbi:hypothetical protein [Nitrobacter sp. TKz-YC01]|uniref:hypothetical protein n=1 Tax=Nitrobacter sp. TKz-YC01 TaxID=3398703 RepID=UPI003A0FB9F1